MLFFAFDIVGFSGPLGPTLSGRLLARRRRRSVELEVMVHCWGACQSKGRLHEMGGVMGTSTSSARANRDDGKGIKFIHFDSARWECSLTGTKGGKWEDMVMDDGMMDR